MVIGKDTGALESFNLDDKDLISRPLIPNFWRPPTDNDNGNQMPERLGVCRNAGLGRTVASVTARQDSPQVITIAVETKLAAGDSEYHSDYTVFGNGDVLVESRFMPGSDLPNLPRLGMQMQLPGEFSRISWYGRGPHESYWDRKTSAAVGLYSGTVQEQTHHYLRPQENANKTDVRWVALTNDKGTGLLVVGMSLLSVSAWPYLMEDLENTPHPYELPRRDTITLNIDYKQMGVGGDNSWGARTHPEFTLPAKPYNYRFILRPYRPSIGRLENIARRALPTLQE